MRIVRLPRGSASDAVLEDVARLRIEVFRAYPYLYAGDTAYEHRYLRSLADGDGTIVLALDGQRLTGAATAMPLADAQDEFGAPFRAAGHDIGEWFYLAESVLRIEYRGQGVGHRFFDEREAAAREGGFSRACFCAVVRASDHPTRPADYRSLEPFWRGRGYEKLDGTTATFHWQEVGGTEEVPHVMQFYGRAL